MAISTAISTSSNLTAPDVLVTSDAPAPAVSWAAIFAGSIAATALSLVLFVLGSGLGLSVVSPWTAAGVGATTFAVSTAIWLVVVQWLSAGVGGYMAGRLRSKWSNLHGDETTFRDTAHGFVTWSLSTLVVAGLLGSAVVSAIGGGASAVTSVAAGAAQGASQGAVGQASDRQLNGYFVDTLFRPSDTQPATNRSDTSSSVPSTVSARDTENVRENKAEASRILVQSVAAGSVSDPDKAQLTRLIANNTGMSQADAQARVDQVLGQVEATKVKAKEAADKARKAGATLSLMTALSLVIGAFIASVAAAFGGKLRDEY